MTDSTQGTGVDSKSDFVSLREVAERTGTNYRTVHRAAQSNKIRTIRFGMLRKVPRREFERILRSGF
jgi:excisionase family DNA binding protein